MNKIIYMLAAILIFAAPSALAQGVTPDGRMKFKGISMALPIHDFIKAYKAKYGDNIYVSSEASKKDEFGYGITRVYTIYDDFMFTDRTNIYCRNSEIVYTMSVKRFDNMEECYNELHKADKLLIDFGYKSSNLLSPYTEDNTIAYIKSSAGSVGITSRTGDYGYIFARIYIFDAIAENNTPELKDWSKQLQ